MASLIDVRMPEDSEEGTTATVANWLKKVGEAVTQHEPLVELDTDKVSMEVPAPADGVLKEIVLDEMAEAEPGALLGRIETGVSAEASVEPEADTPTPVDTGDGLASVSDDVVPVEASSKPMPLSPSVRRLVSQHQLDISAVRGTGKGGRVTRNDVLAFLDQKPAVTAAPIKKAAKSGAIPSRLVPHDTMRRRIANHMVDSLLRTAPHVTAVFEMDMSAIIAHRKSNKAAFADKGVNLTFTAYFVAASVEALRHVPDVNSRWHDDALELYEDMNIGIGTALGDKGLIVPVLQQAQALNLFGIAQQLDGLTQKARAGKLTPADVQNGTFTISNHGVSGSLIATPIIINQPQSAILGIGKLQKRVMVVETDAGDAIQIKPMAYVTLSIDHRALDAYHTNAFLSRFVEVIEGWR